MRDVLDLKFDVNKGMKNLTFNRRKFLGVTFFATTQVRDYHEASNQFFILSNMDYKKNYSMWCVLIVRSNRTYSQEFNFFFKKSVDENSYFLMIFRHKNHSHLQASMTQQTIG